MNTTDLQTYAPAERDALAARFALRVGSALTERTAELPPDIGERLRFAREQALARARVARTAAVPAKEAVVLGSGPLASLGASGSGWWISMGSVLPLIALVAGLLLIKNWHESNQIAAAAEIDASLLADDLPPSAYSDPGFVEFLKAPSD